ncbi:MAG: efflux RND transporter periplasmic adaptor subunit [Thiocapsa sp.]|uniref:efflux RND transporter periplasmic adaptor subunit n=1 Tax=Thiocapsa sp. TaxID=2024551 RepID=UPI001BCBE20E|nr:efflux RND transporter periplasmic adaptor subunit [Thiocapsa sp.]QVL47835.1 MAG: efflux RND transporter periplasmic adaptor subunit [Thiocapsa sp.]
MKDGSDAVALGISEALTRAERKARSARTRRNVTFLLILVCLGTAGYFVFKGSEGDTLYTTAKAIKGDLSLTVTATGRLQPVNQVDVGTEVSGTIQSVEVDFNDRVVAGQILVKLDTEQLEAGFRQSKASLSLAEAGVMEANATLTETGNRLKRIRDLIGRDLSTEEELDRGVAAFARAEAGLAVAQAKVEQAQAQLDADRRALEKAIIRSPIDGIVLERRVESGQTVAAALQTPILLVLAEDLREMVLHVDIDEADVGQVLAGQQATFSVDAYPDKEFPADIRQVRFSPKSLDGVVTYETLLNVDNEELLLMPGMTATAEIGVARFRDVLLVPNAALRFSPREDVSKAVSKPSLFNRFAGQAREKPPSPIRDDAASDSRLVWVLESGVPEAVPVQVGVSDGVVTQILDGNIKPGDDLVVSMSTSVL